MNPVMKRMVWGLAALVLVAGCKVSVETDPEAMRQAQQAGEVAKEAASQAAERAKEGAERAVGQAQGAAQQGLNTAAIKAALVNRKDVDSSKVKVETIERTIYLKGSVPTQREREAVEEIVKAVSGPAYDIMNELQVGKAQ